MARRRYRRQQQPPELTAHERESIQAAVGTALATIDRHPGHRPAVDLVPATRDRPDRDEQDAHRDRRGRVRSGGLRSLLYRNRRQLVPWKAMGSVALLGYLAALIGWVLGEDQLVGWITTGTCAAGALALLVTLAVRRVHPYWGSWLMLCGLAAGAWTSVTAHLGFGYPLLVALCAATALLGLRWWRHVRHPYPSGPDGDRDGVAERGARLMQDWADNAGCPGGPAPGARLIGVRPYEHGYTGELRLVRGKQSLGDIQAALPKLSTALDVAPENLIVEAHPEGPPSRLRVQVVTRSPVQTAVLFDQPIYRDGRILLGPYADGIGEATFVLHTDDSMESGYVLGSKGSGKSRILESVALSAMACTPTVVVYIDGQNGASSPLLWEHALWHGGPDDAEAILGGLLGGKNYRQLYNRRHRLTGYTPSAELPGILVIVDECHKIFTERTTAGWADLAREGRKLGMGILAASQVATLDAFGKGAEADALRSSLVSSNGIALRTASKVQSGVFPGLSVDLMALPKLPGFGYTVDDGDDQHRTAPFRNRWLIGAKQAGERDEPLPEGVSTAEDWFAHIAPHQRLDQRTAAALGPAYADRHAKAAREAAELEHMFNAQPVAVGEPTVPGPADGAVIESGPTATVLPFPRLPRLPEFTPTAATAQPAAEPDPQGQAAPHGLTDAQYAVWDTIANGVTNTAQIAETLALTQRRIQIVVAELVNAGHLVKTGRGTYAIRRREEAPA